jgi:hypothetical protein
MLKFYIKKYIDLFFTFFIFIIFLNEIFQILEKAMSFLSKIYKWFTIILKRINLFYFFL